MPQQTSALAIRSAARSLRALELRKQGATYLAIAADLNISPQAAHKRVAGVLKLMEGELQEERKLLRRLEADRLDALQRACWGAAMTGNLFAIDRVLRIMDRRSKLYGLDQAAVPDTESIEEIQARIDKVFSAYREPMPPPGDDGTTDPEWWEERPAAFPDTIDVEPELELI